MARLCVNGQFSVEEKVPSEQFSISISGYQVPFFFFNFFFFKKKKSARINDKKILEHNF